MTGLEPFPLSLKLSPKTTKFLGRAAAATSAQAHTASSSQEPQHLHPGPWPVRPQGIARRLRSGPPPRTPPPPAARGPPRRSARARARARAPRPDRSLPPARSSTARPAARPPVHPRARSPAPPPPPPPRGFTRRLPAGPRPRRQRWRGASRGGERPAFYARSTLGWSAVGVYTMAASTGVGVYTMAETTGVGVYTMAARPPRGGGGVEYVCWRDAGGSPSNDSRAGDSFRKGRRHPRIAGGAVTHSSGGPPESGSVYRQRRVVGEVSESSSHEVPLQSPECSSGFTDREESSRRVVVTGDGVQPSNSSPPATADRGIGWADVRPRNANFDRGAELGHERWSGGGAPPEPAG